MKQTLRSRLIKWFSARPNEVISGGEMERMVSAVTTYKPSTISRRLREICEDGLIVATYEKGTVFYKWKSPKKMEFESIQKFVMIELQRESKLASQLTLKLG